MPVSPSALAAFNWQPQPAADLWLRAQIADFLNKLAPAARFAEQLRVQTGTRFMDWVDHLILPPGAASGEELRTLGFQEQHRVFRHSGGLFPAVILSNGGPARIAIKVES